MSLRETFDAEGFYAAFDRAVRRRGISLKEVSTETGVSATTLTRMKDGRRPDAASLAALSAWAGINPANYVDGRVVRGHSPHILEKVSLLLREDRQLSDSARAKLESVVEVAYNALRDGAVDSEQAAGPKP